MKQGLRKITAAILLVCFVVGCMPAQNVSAGNIADDESANAETEASEETGETEDQEEQSTSNVQVLDIGEASESEQELQDEDNDLQEDAEDIPEDPECEINHIVIVSPYLETPGTEEIMVSYGDGSASVSEMFLRIKDPNGQTSDWQSEKQADELYLFSESFSDSSEAGTYVVESLGFTDETGEHVFALADYGMDARFGVDQEYDGYEELQPLDGEDEDESDESVSATVVSLDSAEDVDSATDQIVNALSNAENEVQLGNSKSSVDNAISTFSAITPYASSSKIVVALDPGHDSSHTGARSAGGLKEEELTLKIANYCKEELETYSGVSVYMTRTAAACPYPETKSSSSGSDIKLRVQAAVSAGASIFVSFHLNDASATSAKGAEVIVQNDNWRPGVAAESKALAEAILDELANVGVTMRSTKIYSKNSSDTKYSDGSTADYYAVNRWTKENNIPGIIVEHAFLSNTDDVNNFLSTEAGLKKLGVADATGIANYLGLDNIKTPALKSASASNDGIKITWDSISNATGYRVYRKPEGGSWAGFATTTSTSYTDTSNLEIGKTYYYTVRAFTGSESDAMANTYDSKYWSGFESPGVSAKAMGCLKTPSLSKATASAGSIKITWNSVSGASGYRIYRKPSGGSWAGFATTTDTSYTDTDPLEIGTTYYYTVRAFKGDSSTAMANTYYSNYWSDFESPGVSVKAEGVVSTPSLTSATASAGSIKITWKSVSGASGYRVYRKPSGGSWAGFATTTDTSYTDTDPLEIGTTYYYTVRAFKGSSSEAMANTYYTNYWSDFESPGVSAKAQGIVSAPTLKAATASLGSITVTWNSVSGASGYRVYRKPAGGSWGGIATTTDTSYTDSSGLTEGTEYYYTVRAFKGDSSEAMANTYYTNYWSDFESPGVSAKAVMTLGVPALSSATASAGSIKVTWESVNGASGYRVYRKPSGGSWAGIGNSTSTSYTDSSQLEIGTTYYYTVRAYSGDADEALAHTYESKYWSEFESPGVYAKAEAIVSTPSLTSATASAGRIKISWKSVSGASGYRVYRKPSGGSWAGFATTTDTSYTDTDPLEVGTTYYYTVRAFKGNSSEAMANTYYANYWSSFESPGVSAKAEGIVSTPSLKSATSSADGITVTWNSVSGASGYRVYRKPAGGSWAGFATTTDTSYTDTDALEVGTTYYYTVRAFKGDSSEAMANTYLTNYWSNFESPGVSAVAKVSIDTPVLSSATASTGSIKVTWKSVDGASGYRVYRKPSGGSWAGIGNSTSTSYTDSSQLEIGTTYYYTVRAYHGDADEALAHTYESKYWSEFESPGVSAKAEGAVSTPSLSSATASAGSVKISWKSVSGASGYRVYRKPSGGSWAGFATTTDTSYTDTDPLEVGTTYYYTVRAFKGDSAEAMTNTYYANYWSDFESPGVSAKAEGVVSTPTLKSATAAVGSITVTWNSVSGASGYRVYRKPSGGSWAGIATTTDTSYTDSSGLSAGTKYYYTVRAFKGDSSEAMANTYLTSYWSNFDSNGVSATALAALSTPSLTGTTVVNDGIKISWKSVSGATGYRVYRKTSSTSWGNIGLTTSTSYTDTNGGSSGTTYYYTVRAYRGDQSTALANTYDAAYWSDFQSPGVTGSAYEIAGTTTTTKSKMVALFNSSGKKYPSTELSKGGASTIDELAQIYIDEAAAEGIKAEVAWCQMILETGYLQYGGQVSVGQFNFAGIGATDGGAAGASFSTVKEGVRAQIQHLKAYATTSALNNTCVDPRFNLVSRGCAKYVEILGSKENPTGNGWATGAGYGQEIVDLIKKL